MILKVFFKPAEEGLNDIILPFNNQKEMNSFIYRTLGDNNRYHDGFSNYSISSIQGGKMFDESHIIFKESPYIQVASQDMDFINCLISGLEKRKYTFFGLQYERLEINDFNVNRRFDTILTISPVIVKDSITRRKISIDNKNFVTELKKNCVEKLRHKGIEDSTFDIVLRHPEKAKQKLIMVGDIFNICTNVSLYVYGKPNTRKALYNLGIGGSTGSGFGAVKIYG